MPHILHQRRVHPDAVPHFEVMNDGLSAGRAFLKS
jgi:hypothetical protein